MSYEGSTWRSSIFLAESEARKAIFWATPGLKRRTLLWVLRRGHISAFLRPRYPERDCTKRLVSIGVIQHSITLCFLPAQYVGHLKVGTEQALAAKPTPTSSKKQKTKTKKNPAYGFSVVLVLFLLARRQRKQCDVSLFRLQQIYSSLTLRYKDNIS